MPPLFLAALFTVAKIWKQPECSIDKEWIRDFPGGTVVKNPPDNAGDTGSIPGPGRSHTPQSN